MVMRMCLAALDWNSNVNRDQKLSQVGQPVYRVKVDRSGKSSVAPVLVKKSYQWQNDLFNRMVEGLRTDQIPQHQVLKSQYRYFFLLKFPQYPVADEDTLKKRDEFSKADAIAKLQKRLQN